MENNNLSKHISGQFNIELETVRSEVLALGGLVEQQISKVLQALIENNSELAQQVTEQEKLVNDYEVAIDQECVRIIAKRQPTASDLRLMMAIIKIINDLERIGDLVEHAAKIMINSENTIPDAVKVNLETLGSHIIKMLQNVLDSFARMDVEAAVKVHQSDKKVNMMHEGIVRQLLTYMMGDSRSIPFMLEVLFTCRDLARIGDHCKNLAEHIIYFVRGQDVRHASSQDIQQLLN